MKAPWSFAVDRKDPKSFLGTKAVLRVVFLGLARVLQIKISVGLICAFFPLGSREANLPFCTRPADVRVRGRTG